MKKIVALTGAGISAESGLATFRDSGGLWEGYDVMEVASIEGWHKNPEKVLDFYNKRRKQAAEATPNAAHKALVRLEDKFEVTIITQNIDNLHEKAGSSHVIHLHGELSKARSSVNDQLIYDIGVNDIRPGDLCEAGSQLRPHIVWFGEPVPMMEAAAAESSGADIYLIIGTSLAVYPAAGLTGFVPEGSPVYVINPDLTPVPSRRNMHYIREKAGKGTPGLISRLLNDGNNNEP